MAFYIRLQEHITNEAVQSKVGCKELLMLTAKTRKLKLFGHIARMADERLLELTILGKFEGVRSRGRPPRICIDDVIEWCQADLHQVM